jgi:hypothetical protein
LEKGSEPRDSARRGRDYYDYAVELRAVDEYWVEDARSGAREVLILKSRRVAKEN